MIKEVKIELTNLCYRNCIHCSSEAVLIEHPQALDVKIVHKVLKEAKELGASNVVFTGGEATLYENLENVVEYAKSLGLKTKLYTMCHRNNENIELLKNLSNKGLDEIIYSTTQELSLENYEEQSLEDFIKELNETTNLKIGFHHVVTNKTLNTIDNVLNLIEKLDLNKFTKLSFLRFVPHGRGDASLTLTSEEMRVFKEKLIYYLKKYPNIIRIGSPYNILDITHTPCNAASETLIIGFDGRVYPCDAMKYFDYLGIGGNVYEHSLIEIFNSKYFNSIRNNKDFHNGNCTNCKSFLTCKGGCLAQKMIYNFDNESNLTFNWAGINAKRTINPEFYENKEMLEMNIKLGLLSETGELADCLKQIHTHGCLKENVAETLIDEIGDLTWYVPGSLGLYFDFSFEEVANEIFKTNSSNIRKIDDKLIKYCAMCKDPECPHNKIKEYRIKDLDNIVKKENFNLLNEINELDEITYKLRRVMNKEEAIKYSAKLIRLLAKISNLYLEMSYEEIILKNIKELQKRWKYGFNKEGANNRLVRKKI